MAAGAGFGNGRRRWSGGRVSEPLFGAGKRASGSVVCQSGVQGRWVNSAQEHSYVMERTMWLGGGRGKGGCADACHGMLEEWS